MVLTDRPGRRPRTPSEEDTRRFAGGIYGSFALVSTTPSVVVCARAKVASCEPFQRGSSSRREENLN